MADTFDIAVIGGGVVGACTAKLAAERFPGARIAVVDRGLVGHATSARSAGLLTPVANQHAEKAHIAYGLAFYRSLGLDAEHGLLRPIRAVWVVKATRASAFEDLVADPVVVPDSKRARQLLSSALPELCVDAEDRLYVSDAAVRCTAPAGLVEHLLFAGARHQQIACWEGVEVVTISEAHGGVELALSDGNRLRARDAVACSGPWQLASVGAPGTPVRTKKIVALHIDRRPRPDDPVVLFDADGTFLLPLVERGCWLFSYACTTWDVAPGMDLRILPDDREQALAALARRLPQFVASYRGGRAFCDSYTTDRQFVVGRTHPTSRVVIATGANGAGYRLAPAMALRAVECLATSVGR